MVKGERQKEDLKKTSGRGWEWWNKSLCAH